MRTKAGIAAGLMVLAGMAAAAVTVTATAQAQEYPSKPIALIIGNPPGASLEIYGRLYAKKLTESMKQPMLVDFKVGAGTTIASTYVAKSAPDGHTLALISPSFTTSPVQYKNLPFDPIESFAPITLTSTDSYVLVINPGLPARNLQEYIAYARANPGKINVGTTGIGAFNHLAMALLHLMTKTEVTFIHYKGGSQVITDMLAGRIQASQNSVTLAKPLFEAGKIRIAGVTSAKRTSAMPDMPTFAEQGVPGYDVSNWIGFTAPAKTPAAIINRLNSEFRAATKSEELMAALAKTGGDPVGTTPEEFKRFLIREVTNWKNLVRDGNIEMEAVK